MEYSLLIVYLLLGLGLLVAGGELLTSAASRVASILGVRPIIIGLTIVAFGTSTPEAFVSAFASLQQKPDIAIANIVGSNIFNIAFILGIAALIHPLKVESGSLRREVPFVVGSSILVWVLSWDQVLSRWDGSLLLVFFLLFLFICFRTSSAESIDQPEDIAKGGQKKLQFLKIGCSLILLILGAKLLVSGSVGLARAMQVSELLIGLTIVAAGTSLPELATSTMASLRKKDDIAVGNVTGSNIFNILFILGICAVIHPLNVSSQFLSRDIPLMTATSLVAIPILKSGFVITRLEGLLLLILYVGYTILLIQRG